MVVVIPPGCHTYYVHAHLVLETEPSFMLILRWKRV
jgi:hypothetical protein